MAQNRDSPQYLTPEEELADFEPDEHFWQSWFAWAERCEMAAMEQYQNEQHQVLRIRPYVGDLI